MPKKYCTICKKGTEVVFDHSAGETVCSVCSVSGDSEWGSFVDESNNEDCVIVHRPTNPLLIDGDDFSGDVPAEFLSGSLRMLQNRGPRHDKLLLLALQMIEKMADRLDLAATIKDRAIEIYRKVKHLKMRGRKQDAVVAACIYIACRQEDKPRTIKEICTIANGPTKKEIGRAKEFIGKQLEVQTGTIHACDFVMRFCSNLGMNNNAVKAVQDAVKKSEDLDIRRSPTSIAACVIYMITQLSDDKKPLKDISLATSVCEGTIIITYKDLYPHAARLIPMSYAMIEDLKNLPCP